MKIRGQFKRRHPQGNTQRFPPPAGPHPRRVVLVFFATGKFITRKRMAVEMQSAIFSLPAKFEKLTFFDNVSADTMSTPSTPSTPLPSPPIEPYAIKRITYADSDRVLEHLRKFFFRDEPLNVDVKLIEDENGTCLELEDFSVKSIKYDSSLMAVSDSGKVVGVCLNSVDKREHVEEDEEECPNPKFAKILNLLDYVDKEANIFGNFPEVNRVMNCKILSVDSTWRGRGIAKQLMDQTRDIARERGYGLMRVDCTSHFSARAIERLGFECIYELKYSDYKVNGETIFDPEYPHKEVKVYIQKIAKSNL